MFRSRSWFGSGWGRPKNPHSLEHLKYLYNVLSRNQTVSEHNRGLLVESLRCIAEILIWGDQNDSSVFDFFLEKNMLSFFLRIMRQRSGGSSFVCVQLLQTLNILFENIRNETSLYYLLSNNHVNSIIVHKFDFSDEEVMAYYISFLKTLSLKLNAHTIHFFYNEHTNDFPLYTEAIKFFNHPESMVRIAVRTLTLNVYKVEDASMLAFIRDRTAAPYFSNIVWFIGKHIQELDTCVRNDADHQSQNRLADLVAEHLDHLHYLNDILCLNIPDVNQVLTEHLLHKLLIPMYIYSLHSSITETHENSIETATQNLAKILKRKVNFPETVVEEKEATNGKVSCVVALFLLSQVFLIISHAPLIETLSWIILRTDRAQFEKGVGKLLELYHSEYQRGSGSPASLKQPDNGASSSTSQARRSRSPAAAIRSHDSATSGACNERTNSDSDSGDSSGALCNGATDGSNITDEEKQKQLTTDGNVGVEAGAGAGGGPCAAGVPGTHLDHHLDKPFLKVVLSALDCGENDYSALFALSLLYAMANNKGVRSDLLESVLRPKKSLSRSVPAPPAPPPASTANTPPTPPTKDVKYTYNQHVVEQLLHIVMHACQPSCRVRLVTLELSLKLLAQLVTCDGNTILTEAHRACMENARAQSVALLRNFYKSEEIFLDMFEHEYCDMSKTSLNVEWLCMDSAILLPPTGTPLTGIDFTKRLPCGEVERARRAIRVFFLVRDTVLSLQSDVETQLPLTNPQNCAYIEQALDLNNSDLLACTVVWKDGTKMRRFLVIDVMQLILVEPDTKKLGWGVVKLVGFLQDIEVSGDKDDSRCLHITIQKPLSSCGSTSNRTPLLSARFMFDDNIRCMAAKQRLTKGRMKVRQKKMQHIARLLDIPGQSGPPSPAYMGVGVGVGNRNSSVAGRGIAYREARSLFGGSMAGAAHSIGIGGISASSRLVALPGFAAPRRDSTSGVLHRADAAHMRRRRDSDSPSRIAMANAKGSGGSGGSGGSSPSSAGSSASSASCGAAAAGNGIGAKMRSRDSSANRSKSRDTSPRMPRPRSEEIPLELIKKSSPENSILTVEASSKMTIIPRPQTPVVLPETEPETVVLTSDQSLQKQPDKQDQQPEVASITSEETSFIGETSPKKKGSIETV